MFVDRNNVIYTGEQLNNRITIWSENGTNPIRILAGNLNNPGGIFVSTNGDIYVDNGDSNHVVVKWKVNDTNSTVVMNVTGQCLGLFIDINDTLYCSIDAQHKVMKMSLDGVASTPTLIAGNGTSGSAANMLYNPNGIFVDKNFTLYVADYNNNRIQKFELEQVNAITVAGSGANGTISLDPDQQELYSMLMVIYL